MTCICNYCRNVINSDDLFCMHCGKAVIENRCDECNIGLPDNAKFCPQCGAESSFLQNGLLRRDGDDTLQE